MQNIRLESLDLEITTKCNLLCPYCYISLAKRDDIGDMSDETIERVLDLVDKFGVPFTQPIQGCHQNKGPKSTNQKRLIDL